MTVHTLYSMYLLEDKGDGAFRMTSTNPRYAGPVTVSLPYPPVVGRHLNMLRLSGPKKGTYISTSVVTGVDLGG